MSLLEQNISNSVNTFLEKQGLSRQKLQLQQTKKEFEGELTLVVFPLVRMFKKKPEEVAELIGEHLANTNELVDAYNVVKGFLNLQIVDNYWLSFLNEFSAENNYKIDADDGEGTVLVEFSSPNTNKPLHLGHLRNIFLGHSVSNIIAANGKKVQKVQIINDRGIHICKSMLAWQKFGEGETPESSGLKGDKLVGKYYVKFDQEYRKQIKELQDEMGFDEESAKREAPILKEAQEMLRLWEQEDKATRKLWGQMNQWVYDGFDVTYENIGVEFDKLYFESETYLIGKQEVERGLSEGIFFKKEDGSVWVDLSDVGMDQKLLLRGDGTAVYMTQDIGTAILRAQDYEQLNAVIYTVGNEQDYHFKVLFEILSRLGYGWAKNCYHLSYGMVDLPSGKMKSREGTVVDADDLMADMATQAKETTEELGKLEFMDEVQKQQLYQEIGKGALKYFLLKVDPKKRLLFDPKESIDFQGNTGPFIQYTHARINSILVKADRVLNEVNEELSLSPIEKEILVKLHDLRLVVKEAGDNKSPALIANFTYELVKLYNSFYQSTPILKDENKILANFRLALSKKVSEIIAFNLNLLGIAAPERM